MNNRVKQTILAIGAHCGDVEITCAAVLAKHIAAGDSVTILHLTLGEGGNPRVAPQAYGEQKKREALAAGKVIGADVLFAPYKDGELPNDEPVRRFIADVIRQTKPTRLITHWRRSIHKDHTNTNLAVMDALLLSSLEGVVTERPRHRGVKGVFFAENWEDPEDFVPYFYVDVSAELSHWKECVTQYEFIRGGISSFPYLEYYEALARIRGAQAGTRYAVAFDVDQFDKKRTVDLLP